MSKGNIENLISYLPAMLSGEALKRRLEYLPFYDESIRLESQAERLVELNSLYDVYIPNQMSTEIYSKIYLAMLRSLQKKGSRLAVQQKNLNCGRVQGQSYTGGSGIIGGSDSFTIIAPSGAGKSSAINRAVQAVECNIIEIDKPFCKILPCISIQCPFDSSVKNMLLSILKQVDTAIDSHYYDNAVKARATIDMLIGSVSQVCVNHIGLLIVDEIQNVIKSRKGVQLIGALTQLINASGISIVMVGVPTVEPFFEEIDYLARRALGLRYDKCGYDTYFREFCTTLFSYQYVKNKTNIDESIINWLYEHSVGTLALVVSLIHDSQELAILSGYETLDLKSLNKAYQERMGMMHMHIQPSVNVAGKKKPAKEDYVNHEAGKEQHVDNYLTIGEEDNSTDIISYPVDKKLEDVNLIALAEQAKRGHIDMAELLKGKVSVTEITI